MLANIPRLCCRLMTFSISKLNVSKKYLRNTIRVSNGLDSDQERRSVSPDLDPNCLQRLSAGKSIQLNMYV